MSKFIIATNHISTIYSLFIHQLASMWLWQSVGLDCDLEGADLHRMKQHGHRFLIHWLHVFRHVWQANAQEYISFHNQALCPLHKSVPNKIFHMGIRLLSRSSYRPVFVVPMFLTFQASRLTLSRSALPPSVNSTAVVISNGANSPWKKQLIVGAATIMLTLKCVNCVYCTAENYSCIKRLSLNIFWKSAILNSALASGYKYFRHALMTSFKHVLHFLCTWV